MLDIYKMKKTEFNQIPYRKCFNSEEPLFDSIVIIPTNRKHSSGWKCMDFVGCINNKPIVRLSGCSDVLHLDGIGGYGHNWLESVSGVPTKIDVNGLKIDCLPSGYLRLWLKDGFKFLADSSVSDFEIYAVKERIENERNII